ATSRVVHESSSFGAGVRGRGVGAGAVPADAPLCATVGGAHAAAPTATIAVAANWPRNSRRPEPCSEKEELLMTVSGTGESVGRTEDTTRSRSRDSPGDEEAPHTASIPRHSAARNQMTLTLRSPDFQNGGAIPSRFTCDGDDISPALEWSGAPPDAKSLALIVD